MPRPYARVPFLERPLQRDGALHRPRHRPERCHEPVTHRLHFRAAVLLEDVAGDRLVLAEDGAAALVAEAGHHLGVSDEVCPEDGAEGASSRGFPHTVGAVKEPKDNAEVLFISEHWHFTVALHLNEPGVFHSRRHFPARRYRDIPITTPSEDERRSLNGW